MACIIARGVRHYFEKRLRFFWRRFQNRYNRVVQVVAHSFLGYDLELIVEEWTLRSVFLGAVKRKYESDPEKAGLEESRLKSSIYSALNSHARIGNNTPECVFLHIFEIVVQQHKTQD
jgi:hypothetical protein